MSHISSIVKGADIPTMTEDDWKILVSKQEIGTLKTILMSNDGDDNDNQLNLKLYIYIVFARTSPEQKLTIVQEFTKAGNITAMTGMFISIYFVCL
jgi:cation transport ATPase